MKVEIDEKKLKKLKQQQVDFKRAKKIGRLRDIALNNGGTGDYRPELSYKEKKRRKKRRQLAKMSRRRNR